MKPYEMKKVNISGPHVVTAKVESTSKIGINVQVGYKSMIVLIKRNQLAKEQEHPRTYEVAGQLIKTVSEVTERLADLQEKMQRLKEVPDKGPKSVTNALFVGSTKELQALLKGDHESIESKRETS